GTCSAGLRVQLRLVLRDPAPACATARRGDPVRLCVRCRSGRPAVRVRRHRSVSALAMSTDEPEYHEYYCWSPDTEDGTERTEWYVLDAADDTAVAGPFDLDTALRTSARMNQELGA